MSDRLFITARLIGADGRAISLPPLALVHGLAEGMGATVLGRSAEDDGFEVEIGLVAAAG
jgi:hypothetical protein